MKGRYFVSRSQRLLLARSGADTICKSLLLGHLLLTTVFTVDGTYAGKGSVVGPKIPNFSIFRSGMRRLVRHLVRELTRVSPRVFLINHALVKL
jgi:hypothetical protein